MNTQPLPGQSMEEVLALLLLQVLTVETLAQLTRTHVPMPSIAIITLLLCLAFYLHKRVLLMDPRVMVMKMEEIGNKII